MNRAAAYANNQRSSQEELLSEHLPLVKRIALHIKARLPREIELDDLLQAGLMGLMEAAKNYSPDHGASFNTYAGIRIRGSIIDELRRMDWTPRSLQQKTRRLSQATRAVEARTGGVASDAEIAREMGVSLDEYHTLIMESVSSQICSLDENDHLQLHSEQSNPAKLHQDENFKLALAEVIDKLPEKEQLVMSLYYREELNLKEIGAVLEVSESRACQIHGQALNRIRAKLGTSWNDE